MESALKIDMNQAENLVKRMIAKIPIIKTNAILHGRKTTRRDVYIFAHTNAVPNLSLGHPPAGLYGHGLAPDQ